MKLLDLDAGETAPTALLVVDVQHDFLPGGALAVPEGDAILRGIARLMGSGAFSTIVATQDWHPPGHVSFASSHPGRRPFETIELYGHPQTLWPDHCVQGTSGADLHPGLPWARASAIVRKGANPACDSYSGFFNNHDSDGRRPSTGLAGYLRERGVETVHVCGLARDFCCRWTVEDAIRGGFHARLLWDLCRSVNPEGDAALRRDLERTGVVVLDGEPA